MKKKPSESIFANYNKNTSEECGISSVDIMKPIMDQMRLSSISISYPPKNSESWKDSSKTSYLIKTSKTQEIN